MDLASLSIGLPKVKPIDTSKAYLRTIREAIKPVGMGGGLSNIALKGALSNKPLKAVVDPYNQKLYGEAKASDFLGYFNSQIKELENNIKYVTKTGAAPRARTEGSMGLAGFSGVPLKLSAADKAKTLQGYQDEIAKNRLEIEKFSTRYEQKDKMIQSFNMYGDNWDKNFKRTYQNRQTAESNAEKLNALDNSSNLAISAKKKTINPRDVATGTGGTTSLNPFGKLDSGLGI